MEQQTVKEKRLKVLERPRGWDLFFHFIRTIKLIGRLLGDRRIPLARKGLFIGVAGGLLVVLLFPDLLGEFVMGLVLPVAGTILGIPIDAGIDWLAFALAIVNMLRFFPDEIVAEHYQDLFR
ncbi:MAG: hypothetical protein J2P37_04895 [Ktedonobacteraceae bacterium]|nr:hypothetical protein [Ktedonobacteraceae bacterium]